MIIDMTIKNLVKMVLISDDNLNMENLAPYGLVTRLVWYSNSRCSWKFEKMFEQKLDEFFVFVKLVH